MDAPIPSPMLPSPMSAATGTAFQFDVFKMITLITSSIVLLGVAVRSHFWITLTLTLAF